MRLSKATPDRNSRRELQCVVITGASSGIGAATYKLFAEKGFKAIGIARRGEVLKKSSEELSRKGLACAWYECDLSNQQATMRITEQILSEHGCPDSVVFNAGFSANKLFDENLVSERHQELMLNYLSPTWMLDALLPVAKKRGYGHFIAVGSLAACTSFPGNGA